jgi:hypothetical protein
VEFAVHLLFRFFGGFCGDPDVENAKIDQADQVHCEKSLVFQDCDPLFARNLVKNMAFSELCENFLSGIIIPSRYTEWVASEFLPVIG